MTCTRLTYKQPFSLDSYYRITTIKSTNVVCNKHSLHKFHNRSLHWLHTCTHIMWKSHEDNISKDKLKANCIHLTVTRTEHIGTCVMGFSIALGMRFPPLLSIHTLTWATCEWQAKKVNHSVYAPRWDARSLTRALMHQSTPSIYIETHLRGLMKCSVCISVEMWKWFYQMHQALKRYCKMNVLFPGV